ncbi:MAG: HobA family DNA replication regulator [Sulfuricurvum sp.]
MSWFEEQRYEWIPPVANAMEQILLGKTVVLITDHDRDWFSSYIVSSLNRRTQERPMIPIVSLDALYPHFDYVSGGEALDTLLDMIDITFKGEYFFWYVGRGDDRKADIAKRNANSLLWVMDERFQNALTLRSHDRLIDIKLLQLFGLLDKTLNAVLFGEVNVR